MSLVNILRRVLIIFILGTLSQTSFAEVSGEKAGNSSAADSYKQAFQLKVSDHSAELFKLMDGILAFGWKDESKIAELLKKNEPALKFFKDASQQASDGFLFWKKSDSLNPKTSLPKFFDHIDLVRLNTLQARKDIAEGRFINAAESLLSNISFLIQMNQEKNYLLLHSISEQICFDIMAKALEDSLHNDSFGADYFRKLKEKLEQYTQSRNHGFLRVWETEAEFALGALDLIENEAKKDIKYDAEFWDDFKREFRKIYEATVQSRIEASKKNDPEIYNRRVAQLQEKAVKDIPASISEEKIKNWVQESENKWWPLHDYEKEFLKSQLVQEVLSLEDRRQAALVLSAILVKEWIPRKFYMPTYFYAHQAKLSGFFIAASLKSFQLEKQKFPDRLSELTPGYVTLLPGDPFNDFQPLHYKKTEKGFIVYSLGPDKIDQDGKEILDFKVWQKDRSKITGDIVFIY